MKTIGLIGKSLKHSFSKSYFTQKFKNESITNFQYLLFELKNIDQLPELIKNTPELIGFNVTIPYKEQIFKYLNYIDTVAQQIGAVNTVKIIRKGNLTELHGFNTDLYGFTQPLIKMLDQSKPYKALILGTGGAAKAVKFALHQLQIDSKFVSRYAKYEHLTYTDLSEKVIKEHLLIINCSPVGMYPDINSAPPLPYQYINEEHILYDLVYNPEETLFLKKGKKQGAQTINGLKMLHLQADKAWEIFETK